MSDRISPTAHYTGAVWARHGLSHPAFQTVEGRVLHTALMPTRAALELMGAPSLDGILLARHRRIDELLEAAIAEGRVTQVIEVAAGMSARGWRFSERHGSRITYLEADLPAMARRKREALERAGATHGVADVDALAASGPRSLAALAGTLDRGQGLAIVTEGLVNYFERRAVEDLWRRIAATLGEFADGLYLSDLFLREQTGGLLARGFSALVGAFVRGRVHVHYADEAEAERALTEAGFGAVALHTPSGEHSSAGMIRVVAARPGQPPSMSCSM